MLVYINIYMWGVVRQACVYKYLYMGSGQTSLCIYLFICGEWSDKLVYINIYMWGVVRQACVYKYLYVGSGQTCLCI